MSVTQIISDKPGASSTLEIREDEFVVWEIGFDEPMQFEYTIEVLKGPPIDVILTDQDRETIKERSNWRYYPDASQLNVRHAALNTELPPATNYLLIFDNSDRLEARPPTNFMKDNAIVMFEFSLTPLVVRTPPATPTNSTRTESSATNRSRITQSVIEHNSTTAGNESTATPGDAP